MTLTVRGVALTGGTGFLGRAVLRHLGDIDTPIRALTRTPRTGNEKLTWIDGDLGSETALAELATDTDTFIHIAGLTSARSLDIFRRVNAEGVEMAVQTAREAGVRRFILISSLAAREPHLSDYAKSKHEGERTAKAAVGQMELIIIRPPAILGPNDPATAVMLNTMKQGWLPAPGGKALKAGRMSFIYVEDVARFILEQIDTPVPDQPIEPVGGSPATSWQQLARTASDVLSKPVRLIPVPPSLLTIAAFLTQTMNAVFRRSGVFNTGKVRELLHNDWVGDTEIAGACTLHDTLRLAFELDVDE